MMRSVWHVPRRFGRKSMVADGGQQIQSYSRSMPPSCSPSWLAAFAIRWQSGSLKDLARFCGAKQLNGRDSCNRTVGQDS